MKRVLVITALIVLLSVPLLKSQEIINKPVQTGVCHAGNKVKRIYIPPPEQFLKKNGQKSTATINVYYSNTPAYIATAVDYAVSILESVLTSEVPVNVLVTSDNLESGVLANSSASALAGGWAIDAINPDAWYPVALAEKIFGSNLNDTLSADIILNINKDVNWYLGVDGNAPAFQYDMVTVIIHELIHGLGFFDTFSADASTGSWGAASMPVIYDTYIENNPGNLLIDTVKFPNPSAALKAELTSGQLYFNGPLIRSANSGNRVRIYAPATYDPGSSISHLDESTPDPEGLMTPFIDKGEAIHDPGILALAILADLGWINTRFIHNSPQDTEEHLTQIDLTAKIVSDTTYDRNKVGIVWSFDGFATSDTLYMSSPLSDDTFTTTITIPFFDAYLEYYFYVTDHFSRIYRSPSYIDEFRYSVRIGMDTIKPVVLHTPVEYYLEKIDSIKFEALAADNIGIDTVYVEYRVNEGTLMHAGLTAGEEYLYSAGINVKPLALEGGDSIHYRIIAKDKAAVPNVTALPSDGFYSIRIEDIGSVVSGYTTDFSNASADFFNIGFSIAKPENFSHYGLHTEHPYKSPDVDGGEYEFTALLRHPVKYDSNGMIITFSEVVLVEPGETGSIYGDNNFFDYVIIEGSADFGKTWFPLVDGYDCRFYKTWETAYNSAIVNGNSNYIGQQSMLQKRYLFPKISSYISDGDSMLVRFRLFSDPYAHGWGWAIEDLHIGPLVDNVELPPAESAIIFPNPGSGFIRINDPDFSGKRIRYTVFSSTGIRVKTGRDNPDESLFLDISDQPSGIYFILIENPPVRKTLRYLLIK